MKAFAIVISGLLLATPAFAQAADGNAVGNDRAPSGQSQDNASGTSASNEEERRICRRVETNTGSRVPFRTLCLTERQWEDYRRRH